ncbi:hypothetical protein Hdeb2414_s0652g00929901 [Helianthus debilis subsp. tardiflorus]
MAAATGHGAVVVSLWGWVCGGWWVSSRQWAAEKKEMKGENSDGRRRQRWPENPPMAAEPATATNTPCFRRRQRRP